MCLASKSLEVAHQYNTLTKSASQTFQDTAAADLELAKASLSQLEKWFKGYKFVVLQEESSQQRVDIKVGIESDERVEIEEALEEGQIIVAP